MTTRVSYDIYESLLSDTLMIPVSDEKVVTVTTAPIQQQQQTSKELKVLTRSNYKETRINQQEILMDQLIEARGHFIIEMQKKQYQQRSTLIPPIHICKHTCTDCYNIRSHYCTDYCDLFRYKDVYICETTGNVHFCTSDTCDRLLFNNQVSCELTHIIHSNAYCMAKTRQTEMRSRKSKHTTSKAGAHNTQDGEPDSMGPCQLDIYNISGEYHLTKSSNKKDTEHNKKRDNKAEYILVTNTITSIIKEAMPLLKEYTQELIKVCYTTWVKIIVTCKRNNTIGYTIPYHCIIILYCIFRQGLVLVEPDSYRMVSPNVKCALLSCSSEDGDDDDRVDTVFTSIRKLSEVQLHLKHAFSSSSFSRAEDFFLE